MEFRGLYCPPQIPAGFLRIPEDFQDSILADVPANLLSPGAIFLRTGDSPEDFQTGLVPGLMHVMSHMTSEHVL